jgi:hypothetical protein
VSRIDDEKIKLVANALDRASTACLAVGVIAPLAAALYEMDPNGRAATAVLALGALIWLAAAIALHLAARWTLNRLSP